MPGYLRLLSNNTTHSIFVNTFFGPYFANLPAPKNATQSNIFESLGLFSDFDGTLSEIKKRPRDVSINKDCKSLLSKLSKHFITGIISGRPVADIKKRVGINNIYYIGNHGAEIIKPCATVSGNHYNNLFVFPIAQKAAPYIKEIYISLSRNLNHPFGLDFKKYSASVHYRNHPDPISAKDTIYGLLKNYITNDLLEVNEGRMVIEIRIKGINKATALKKIIRDEKIHNFIYFGDDYTDIDIFKMKEPKHLNIVVRNSEANAEINKFADIFVDGPGGVAEKLHELLESSQQ